MWIIFRLQGTLNYYFHFVDSDPLFSSPSSIPSTVSVQTLFNPPRHQPVQLVAGTSGAHVLLPPKPPASLFISVNQHQNLKGSDFPNQLLQQKLDWQLCEFSFCVCICFFFYLSVCKSVFFKGMV